mmetsp:Transcript_22725/g.65391  ORF Transcript_22725/g.65391 Transcript_22725/m.65391 type:complete len:237 (-) Transcript_22725:924-1634(-)
MAAPPRPALRAPTPQAAPRSPHCSTRVAAATRPARPAAIPPAPRAPTRCRAAWRLARAPRRSCRGTRPCGRERSSSSRPPAAQEAAPTPSRSASAIPRGKRRRGTHSERPSMHCPPSPAVAERAALLLTPASQRRRQISELLSQALRRTSAIAPSAVRETPRQCPRPSRAPSAASRRSYLASPRSTRERRPARQPARSSPGWPAQPAPPLVWPTPALRLRDPLRRRAQGRLSPPTL